MLQPFHRFVRRLGHHMVANALVDQKVAEFGDVAEVVSVALDDVVVKPRLFKKLMEWRPGPKLCAMGKVAFDGAECVEEALRVLYHLRPIVRSL